MVPNPVHFAGEAVRGERYASERPWLQTWVGVVVYYAMFFIIVHSLGTVTRRSTDVFALVVGFMVWLVVFR